MSGVGPARQEALVALGEVRKGRTVSDALRSAKTLSGPDRALETQLVYGVLRHRRYLDAWIARYRQGRLDAAIRDILRLAFFQLGFLDRVPDYAVVNAAVEQAKQVNPGTAVLVNAVLRRGQHRPPRPDSLSLGERYSYPDWLVEKWRHRYGERTEALLHASNRIPPLMLRVNSKKGSRDKILQDLRDHGIHASPSLYLPESIRMTGSLWLEDIAAFRQGLVTVQDESSMLVGWVLDTQPGDQVVDMAAGVGGKAIHVVERTDGAAHLTALDISQDRLSLLKENLCRTGYQDVVRVVCQSAEKFAQSHSGEFDRVLLDAPCSGLGVLRRRVDAKWTKHPDQFMDLTRRQVMLLKAAVRLAKPDGVMVYSTCSTEPEETLEVIDQVIQDGDVVLEDVTTYLPHPKLGDFVTQGMLVLSPGDLDMDGFFIARLRKRR